MERVRELIEPTRAHRADFSHSVPAGKAGGRTAGYDSEMAEPQTESAVAVVDEASASADTAPVEELLVEEISIDGMCGVY